MNKTISVMMTILLIAAFQTKIMVMDLEDLRKLGLDEVLNGGDRNLMGPLETRHLELQHGTCTDRNGKRWVGKLDVAANCCYQYGCYLNTYGKNNQFLVRCTGGIVLSSDPIFNGRWRV